MNYTVLSDRILTGTIADLTPTIRLAWLAILFEADRLRGRVKLPVRDLAKKANISNEQAAEALRVLQEPDPLSSSPEHDGRRLLPIEGEPNWYIVTTWERHAAEREVYFHRLRQSRYDSKKRKNENGDRE